MGFQPVSKGGSSSAIQAQLKALDPYIRDPRKLRVIVLSLVALAAVALVYWPLEGGIAKRQKELERLQERGSLVEEIVTLRTYLEIYESRLPEEADVNFWSEHLMNGMRLAGLKLRSFEPRKQDRIKFAGYTGLIVRVEVEGPYTNLVKFLGWLEYNEVFCRVIVIRSQDNNGTLLSTVSIAALMR